MAVSPWLAGQRITADRLNDMLPTWTAWTPAWTTSSGNNTPSFGNATVDCKYAQTGDLVVFEMEITFGSTTNFGAAPVSGDNWRFSLPVTASETQLICGFGDIQSAVTSRWPVRARLTTTTAMEIPLSGRSSDNVAPANSNIIDSVTPFTWASGHILTMNGHYQAA